MDKQMEKALTQMGRAKLTLLEWERKTDIPPEIEDLQVGSVLIAGLLVDKQVSTEQAVAYLSKAVNVAYQMGLTKK
jgi:hypothetical protein